MSRHRHTTPWASTPIGLALVLLWLAGAGCGGERGAESAAGGTETVVEVVEEVETPSADAPSLLEELGDHGHPVTTSSPLAQRYFDQGLILTYGFNHEAAAASFQEATRLDPECAMCFWGLAYALGPNINAPMGPEAGRAAYAAAQQALALSQAEAVTAKERALIEALALRYAEEPPAERAELDTAYAMAMRGVREAHPDDVDVAVLTAEALMDLYPWDYWTSDAEPREYTPEILALLEWSMEQQPDHVGANHYYIHSVEEFFPERGVPAAERLGGIAPDAGHLVHMPSHIFWRVGRYDDALEINQRAAAADEQFFATCRAGPFYRAAYYPHNIHFLWAAASAEGRSEIALASARRLEAATAEQVGEWPFLEEFMAIPMFTLARFGKWDAVLGLPEPAPETRYLVGVWHYVRGLAQLRGGNAQAAQTELDALRAVVAEEAMQELILAGGTAPASQLLAIGQAHLEGEIAAARGDVDAAVAGLESAVAQQDALVYMEPPPWYFPTRQALAAVLLDAGRAAEAESVYRADLDRNPRNGWSLYGLTQSLRAQGRNADAAFAERGYRNAWARADVQLTASRF